MARGDCMNIYMLENGDITEHRGCGYYHFVIVANDEDEARRMAFNEAVGNDTDICDEEKRWMDGRASCVKIGNDENQYNMPFIVSENFNQGD